MPNALFRLAVLLTVAPAALVAVGCRPASPPGSPAGQEGGSEAGVRSEASEPRASANPEKVVVGLDQTARYGSLSLRLLELDDSRCPIGVQCVWEGQVTATIEARRSDPASENAASPETVELILRAGHETASAVAAGHELRLLGAEPHPREGVTPERAARSVTLEVQPL